LAKPIVGDWDGDGADEIGLYHNGRFYLDSTGNGTWDSVSGGDTFYNFGIGSIEGTALPVVGDWDANGVDDLGLYNQGRFYLDTTGNGVWDAVSGGDTFSRFGIGSIEGTAFPVVGDWDANGADDLGLYNQGRFYLDTTGNRKWDAVSGGDTFHFYNVGPILNTANPIVGDWDGDQGDEIGLSNQGRFYLDANGNGAWNSVSGGDTFYNFGVIGVPLSRMVANP